MAKRRNKPTAEQKRIGAFIDTAVKDPAAAKRMLRPHPELLNARWSLGETVLHFLAVEGYADAVRQLIQWGANVNLVSKLDHPSLLEVVILGNVVLAKSLLDAGADPNGLRPSNESILAVALGKQSLELVSLLLDNGATFNDEFEAMVWSPTKIEPFRQLFVAHGFDMNAFGD